MDDQAESYHCRNCGAYVGEVNPIGELVALTMTIETGSIRCGQCGARKVWHRSDYKLDRIVRGIARRRLAAVRP